MKNLTSGNIRSQLMFLALPLIAGNMLQQFYHTIDALVIGRFAGPAAFAAIGVSGTVMNLFIFVINGFCTGISIILAQFYGRGDQRGFCREFFTSLASGCVFTAAISILGIMSLSGVLQMIGTPAEVAAPAQAYLVIIFCGLMTTFLYNFCSAVLRAAGDTRAALFFLAAAECANLALDLVFVALLHRGVAGAGWATILSQGISVLLCLLYMKQKAPVLLLHRDDMVLEPFLLKRTWRCCSVTALHQSSVYIGKLLVQGTVNSLGTGTIAAFTAASRIEGFANSFGDSGCASVAVFVGQNMGTGCSRRAREGFLAGIRLLLLLGLLSSFVMYVTAPAAMSFLLGAGSGAAFSQGTQYLRTISVFYVLCFAGNGLVGYFNGTGRAAIPMAGAIMHLTLRVVLSWKFARITGLGAVGAATGIGWLAAVALWWGIYLHGRRSRVLDDCSG